MRMFLAFVLLLNSYVAVGGVTASNEFSEIEALIQKEPEVASDPMPDCAEQFRNSRNRGPAAAPQCQTPSQLMAANVNTRDFTRICRQIVAGDQSCQKLKEEKRMSCNAKRENEILSTANLLSKAGQCIKGFAWDSMVDLGKFVLELIKMYVDYNVNSTVRMIRFLSDSDYRAQVFAKAKSASRLGKAFLNSAGLYFAREFPRNLAKHPFNPMLAVGETLAGPLVRFMTDAIQQMAAYYIPQYQCMNGTAKLYTICRILGDFIMPPTMLFTFLKFGVRGLAMMAKTQVLKIARVRGRFAEANELRRAAQVARRDRQAAASRITVDHARPPRRTPPAERPTPRPQPPHVAHPKKPAKPAPLVKPIEEHTPDELIEVARSEQTELSGVANASDSATPAVTEAQSAIDNVVEELSDTDEYKAVLEGLNGVEKTEAANAIEALSKSGASPGIVVGLFKKYGPQFSAEVARTPAGSENLWSKLARYVKREKTAGKSDEAIQRQIDDAFKCN